MQAGPDQNVRQKDNQGRGKRIKLTACWVALGLEDEACCAREEDLGAEGDEEESGAEEDLEEAMAGGGGGGGRRLMQQHRGHTTPLDPSHPMGACLIANCLLSIVSNKTQ